MTYLLDSCMSLCWDMGAGVPAATQPVPSSYPPSSTVSSPDPCCPGQVLGRRGLGLRHCGRALGPAFQTFTHAHGSAARPPPTLTGQQPGRPLLLMDQQPRPPPMLTGQQPGPPLLLMDQQPGLHPRSRVSSQALHSCSRISSPGFHPRSWASSPGLRPRSQASSQALHSCSRLLGSGDISRVLCTYNRSCVCCWFFTCCNTFSVNISWSLEISTTFPSICLHKKNEEVTHELSGTWQLDGTVTIPTEANVPCTGREAAGRVRT